MNKKGKGERKKNIGSVSVMLTDDCNFACDYCYEKKRPTSMNWETLKSTLHFLDRENPKGKRVSVNLFGGEPTLEWDLIVKAINYANENFKRKFSFGMTSNGYALNEEKIDWLSKHNVGVLFSFDGIRESQDTHRVLVNGDSTYDRTLKNLKYCIKKNVTKTVRLTVTPKNIQYLYESIDFILNDLGAPTVAPTPVNDNFDDFDEETREIYNEQYDKIDKYFKDRLIAGKNPGLNYYRKCFRHKLSDNKLKAPCGASQTYAGISTDGGLYPCHRFPQWPEWEFGDVWNGVTDKRIVEIFEKYDVTRFGPKCAKCDVGFCGGGCPASNYSKTGSIFNVPEQTCNLMKEQWSRSMKIFDELSDKPQFHERYNDYIDRYNAYQKGTIKPLDNKEKQKKVKKINTNNLVYSGSDNVTKNKQKSKNTKKPANSKKPSNSKISKIESKIDKMEKILMPLSKIILEGVDKNEQNS